MSPSTRTTRPTHPTRRDWLAFAAALAAAPRPAAAQRPETLRIVVGYPPGGSVDVVARKLGERLTGRAATTVVVENKPGAAGRVGLEDVRRAAPGSALVVTPASTVTLYPHVYRQLSYDPFADFVPVAAVATTGFALAAGPQVPASVTTLAELVAWARAQPAPVACGNAGAGSLPHFLSLMAARALGFPVTPVPYRGGSAAMQGSAAGEAPLAVATESSALALRAAGRLRVLATTWTQRSPFLPDVPTFAEAGVAGLAVREWFGVLAPARTPHETVEAQAEAMRAALTQADVRETWTRLGLAPEFMGPDALREAMRREHDQWGPVVRASGFTPEAG